jgi:cytochrome oxidase Cu insertion factor (SCO1/SenC/PrrC family)
LLSVTLDPAYDTPKVLSDYAAFHHADPKIWTFATGDEKNIDSLLARFPFTGKPRAALSHMASPPP